LGSNVLMEQGLGKGLLIFWAIVVRLLMAEESSRRIGHAITRRSVHIAIISKLVRVKEWLPFSVSVKFGTVNDIVSGDSVVQRKAGKPGGIRAC